MVFSSSCAMALKNTGDSFYYFKKHLFYVVLGLFSFYLGINLDLAKLRSRTYLVLFAALFFSFLVFIPGVGKEMGGASRWIVFLGVSFQPSEFFKLAVIIFLAHIIAYRKDEIRSFVKGLLPILLLVVFLVIPVLLQPDLGTTITILAVAFLMLFAAGAQMRQLFFLFLAGGAAITVLSVFSPYRMRRLTTFLDPWKDPLGAGYQIIQSLIAVSSGHIMGLGLGNSKQKFLYLPQQYADFIFAIMCEELGLIGASIFIVILIMFFIRGLIIANRVSDFFLSMLGAGIIMMFAAQAFLNIAVVLALVPTTGLPLPFISYGGTSIVINLFAAGIVANISKR